MEPQIIVISSSSEDEEDYDHLRKPVPQKRSRLADSDMHNTTQQPSDETNHRGRESGAPGEQDSANIDLSSSQINDFKAKIIHYRQREGEVEGRIQALRITETEVQDLVAQVVRFAIFRMQEKAEQPIKRQQLLEVIQQRYKEQSRSHLLPTAIITKAQAQLIITFGLELKEVSALNGPAGTMYILRSALPHCLRARLIDSDADRDRHGLIMVVLALLYLEGDRMSGDELTRHLLQLGVPQGDVHSDIPSSNVSHILDGMVRCRYLVKLPNPAAVNRSDPLYAWGDVAKEEIGKENIKRFIAEEMQSDASEETIYLDDDE